MQSKNTGSNDFSHYSTVHSSSQSTNLNWLGEPEVLKSSNTEATELKNMSAHREPGPSASQKLNVFLDWEHTNAPTVTNDEGGKQSKLHRDWTLVPWDAMALVIQVLEEGAAKYGKDNWKTIPVQENFQHLFEHTIAAYQCEDDELLYMEHLTHIICRALFTLQLLYEDIHGY